jgi:hypothetical protein
MLLTEVRERIQKDDETKWDQTILLEELQMMEGRLCCPRLYRADYPRGLALSGWATAQMCQRLRIPTAYYKRCPTWLQDTMVNYGMHGELTAEISRKEQERPEQWLLRSRRDTLRGVLSERYAKLNNADVFAAVEPVVKDRFDVQWLAITEESWHLRLVDPALAREAVPGDRLCAGIHIANSEVGKRAVTVDALVYRLVCANGLIRLIKGKSLLYQRHIAISQPRFEAAVASAVRDAMVQSTGFMERMAMATQESLQDVSGVIETLADRWSLSETIEKQIRETLERAGRADQETLYGLVNAVTNVAQTLDPDDRYDLEALAGRLVETGPPTVLRRRETVRRTWDREEALLRMEGLQLAIA